MIFFWLILIAVVSFIWALISYKRDKVKREVEVAKKEIAQGRVIYHSSDSESSEA